MHRAWRYRGNRVDDASRPNVTWTFLVSDRGVNEVCRNVNAGYQNANENGSWFDMNVNEFWNNVGAYVIWPYHDSTLDVTYYYATVNGVCRVAEIHDYPQSRGKVVSQRNVHVTHVAFCLEFNGCLFLFFKANCERNIYPTSDFRNQKCSNIKKNKY